MKYKLPPLKSLIAFESVVRLGSVTKAAEEMHVTHGAVSKQVANMEQWMGRPLFANNRKLMQPTEQAVLLAEAADQALRLIADAVEDLRAGESAAGLQVVVPSTFAMRWLMPRLWSFAAANGGMEVRVRQTHTGEDWQEIPFDVAIRPGTRFPGHLVAAPFLRERLGLVVSPGAAGMRPIGSQADLEGCRLLRATTRPGELERWLDAAGLEPARAAGAVTFPHFYLALEAALAGAGALVCPLATIDELLSKVELREPLPGIRVEGPVYSVLYSRSSAPAAAIAFVDWLSKTVNEPWAEPGQAALSAMAGFARPACSLRQQRSVSAPSPSGSSS